MLPGAGVAWGPAWLFPLGSGREQWLPWARCTAAGEEGRTADPLALCERSTELLMTRLHQSSCRKGLCRLGCCA